MSEIVPEPPPPAHSDEPEELVGRMPTPTESALLEFGRQLIIKSAESSQEFHKTMLEVSATFGTLITTLLPLLIWGKADTPIPFAEGWLLLLPSSLMLLSSVVFAIGYYPRHRELRLSIPTEVLKIRQEVLKSRQILAGIGMGLFCSALLLIMILVVLVRRGLAV
ncbi:MAG: hypothetical protein ACXW5U_31705 [Thermoanaerobaculia bacterium]